MMDEIISQYSNKAETKISELTSIIQAQLAIGNEASEELASAIELLDFQETIHNPFNNWTDENTTYWIEYFKTKYALFDTAIIPCDPFTNDIVVPGTGEDNGIYATITALELLRTNVNVADQDLSERILALENFDYSSLIPQSLIDSVTENTINIAANTTSIGSLTDQIEAMLSALNAHISDSVKHITAGEREAWNSRVTLEQLNAAIADLATALHGHEISDIVNLETILNSLQTQINDLPVAEDGEDGITPVIGIGTVTSGSAFNITLSGSSTLQNPILDFVLVPGEKGDGFHIDKYDDLVNKSIYDSEDPGYAFLAQDTGNLYFLISEGLWSDPIPFKGWNGWTPRIGLYQVNPDLVVQEVLGFFGGSGTPPVLAGPVGDPSPRFFLTETGYTNIALNGTNVRGRPGSDGVAGRGFIIDVEGTDRSTYDESPQYFTFLNTTTGKVSWKLTSAPAEWSAQFQWTGPQGPPGDGEGGSIVAALDDLIDVVIATPLLNQIIQYNGTNWANQYLTQPVVVSSSTNYVLANAVHNKIIHFTAATDIIVHAPAGLIDYFSVTILKKGVGNVTIVADSGATLESDGVTLTVENSAASIYSDDSDVFTAIGSLADALSLDSLSDVIITSVATNDRLKYNGSAWINSQLVISDFTVSHNTLIGRASSGDGPGEEILIGNGLQVTSSTLVIGGELYDDIVITGNNAYSINLGVSGGDELTEFTVVTTGRVYFNSSGNEFELTPNRFKLGKNNTVTGTQGNAIGQDNVVSGNYSLAVIKGSTVASSWSFTAGEANTHNVTANNSMSGGYLNIVGDGSSSFSGGLTLTTGAGNINYGRASYLGGIGGRVLWTSDYRGGFVHAMPEEGGSGGLKPPGVEYVTAAAGAINISRNTAAQTSGHGAYGRDSGIIGGVDGDIPITSPRSIVLGGNLIKAREDDPDQVYVPNFNIVYVPANDNSLTQVLVRDSSTGLIKYKTVASFGSGGAGVTDGDKGDIIVSGTGTVWTIDSTIVLDNFVYKLRSGSTDLSSPSSGWVNYNTTSVDINAYINGSWIGLTRPMAKTVSATSYTLTEADRNYIIYFTAATLITVTLTNTLSTNFQATLVKDGVGDVRLNTAYTLSTVDGQTDITDMHGAATVLYRGANVWTAFGPLGSSVGIIIQDSGTSLTFRPILNFTSGLTAVDNSTKTDIKLGGVLIDNVVIDGSDYSSYTVTFTGLTGFAVSTTGNVTYDTDGEISFTAGYDGFVVNTPGGIFLNAINDGVNLSAGGTAGFTLESHRLTITTGSSGGGTAATGDVYYRSSGGYFTRLGIGSTGQVLTVASGLPSWATPSGGGGGGITNSGANNEFVKSDGTNVIGTKIFGSSTGIIIGDSTTTTGRTINSVGGDATTVNGRDLTISTGSAYTVSGNGNGGGIFMSTGAGHGTGTYGSYYFAAGSSTFQMSSTLAALSASTIGISGSTVTLGNKTTSSSITYSEATDTLFFSGSPVSSPSVISGRGGDTSIGTPSANGDGITMLGGDGGPSTNGNGGHLSFLGGAKVGTGKNGSISFHNVNDDFGGGARVINISSASVAPTTNPTSSVILYSDSSDDNKLKIRTPSGSVFNLAGQDTIPITFQGNGANITTGTKVYYVSDYAFTITGWTLLAGPGQTGSISIDIWQDTYTNFAPTVGDTVFTAGTKPALSSTNKNQALSGLTWTATTIAKGSIVAFNVDSVSGLTMAQLFLHIRRI